MHSLTSQEIQELLTQRNNAIIAVNRPEAGPQVTPVWYLWDGEDFYFFTIKGRSKYTNILRNPSISLIVDGGPRYVAAYGQAQQLDSTNPNAIDLATRLTTRYLPPEQAAARVNQMLNPDLQAVLFKLHPEKMIALDYSQAND